MGDPYNIFGWITVFFAITYKLPIIIKLDNTLNLKSLLLQASSYIFATIHGVLVEDVSLIVLNSLALCQNIIIYKTIYLQNNILKSDEGKLKVEIVPDKECPSV
jgi:hypothetical protein